MDVRTVGRTTVDAWLRVARLPIDTASRLLPNGDRGPRTPALLVVDRIDATIRDTIGSLLGDEELRADATRRRAAADERQNAIKLRVEAEQKKREADARLARQQDSVDQRRTEAERTAQENKQQADRERAEREQRAKRTAAKQEEAVNKVEQQKVSTADKQAKKKRLQVLDSQADALDTQTDALASSDEAQRLRKATSAAKASRKRSS